MSHLPSNTARLIADMQPSESSILSDDDSVAGVSLEPKHLLDLNESMDGTSSAASYQAGKDGALIDVFDSSDDGTVIPRKSRHDINYPTLGEASKVQGKRKEQAVIDRLESLSVGGSASGVGATMINCRVAGDDGEVHVIKTDWDHLNFTRHAVDGYYHCPFSRCRYVQPKPLP